MYTTIENALHAHGHPVNGMSVLLICVLLQKHGIPRHSSFSTESFYWEEWQAYSRTKLAVAFAEGWGTTPTTGSPRTAAYAVQVGKYTCDPLHASYIRFLLGMACQSQEESGHGAILAATLCKQIQLSTDSRFDTQLPCTGDPSSPH